MNANWYDREGGRNDCWRPMPDGSVKMGAIRLTGTEKKTKKDETTEGKEIDPQILKLLGGK